ncbi:MAG TPA: hypothetical protein VGW39_09480 [Chthoniobacterales bacterium]|nr:hypothetical protein [Chthoniobacterales bacterium]
MTTLTTNRFLTNALRMICYAAVLTACSAWAAVVNWQLSPIGSNGSVGAIKELSQPGYTNTAGGLNNRAATDASQVVFQRAPETAAATLADALNENPQTRATRIQQSESAVSQESAQISTSAQPVDSFLVVDLQAQPALQSGGALAHAFDEEFVSVPTVQFASMASGSKDLSGTSMAAVSVDPAPVPEMSALFPIIGLIAAVSCTRILRRRRAAQLGAPQKLA